MSYRLGVSNIYELLDDENEREGSRVAAQLSKQEASKGAASKAPTSSGSTGQSKPRTTPQGAGPRKENAGRGENTQRADRPDRRPRPDNRPPRQQRVAEEGGEVAKDDRKANQPMRRREGPRPERRFERAPGSAPTGPTEAGGREKRVYERRSGTGRGREIKKGGGGRGNWGNITDTGAEEPAETATEEKTEKPAEGAQPPTEGTEPKPAAEPKEQGKQEEEEEEEDKTMTLDEYLKKKQEKAAPFQLPPPRVVESENPEWKKFVPLQRDEEEKAEAKPKKNPEEKKQKDQTKKEKVSVDEIFKVQEDSPKRQQRGPPRDNKKGPRAGPNQQRKGPKTEAPRFSEANFPALATTKA